jgi:hypothetical protein
MLVRAAALALLAGCAVAGTAGDFVPLFNGRDLSGWIYGAYRVGAGYRVENGVLFCTKSDGGNLYTEKEYRDFLLRFEFRLTPNANNGIGIRAPLRGLASQAGMEIQILDDSGSAHKKFQPAQYHGSIYGVVAAKRGHLKPVGEWNEEEILAQGRRIVVRLNGAVIVDADLDAIQDEAILKRHHGLRNEKGHVGLLGHGTRVEFRNVRIKEL